MTVLVTIGIVVKNCESTIKDTVESIVKQDFPPELTEVILVDDGCQDKTVPTAIDRFSKSKLGVRICRTISNGLGKARQMVVDNAKGKYIIWVDGDMTLSKDHVRRQVDFMKAHPNVAKTRGKWRWTRSNSLVASLESMKLLDYERRHTSPRLLGSMLVGIGGSICRLQALRQVGGFDTQIKGAGEDVDIAAKMLKAGWSLRFSDAEFYHGFKETWNELWNQYLWYGYGTHYVSHKHRGLIQIWTRIPPVAFFSGFSNSIAAYKSNHLKVSLLLPFQNVFKQAAWYLGFIKGHLENYGHAQHEEG